MSQNNDLIHFLDKYPDEKACRKHLESVLWNGSPTCPHCKSEKKIYRYKNGKLFKCAECKKQFQVTTGTIYESSNIPLRKWFLAFYLISTSKKGLSSIQLSKALGVTQKSAWYLSHKIRYMLNYHEEKELLTDVVECDETYVGGKKRGKRGRGSENKTPVFGMLQREGNLIIMPVENTKRSTIEPIIHARVAKGTHIMSDEWWAYKRLHLHYKHSFVTHGRKEYVNGKTHVNSLEGAWSLFKRSIRGVYHRPSRKHLSKYCAEFQFKYNTRKDSEMNRFAKVVTKSKVYISYRQIIT